MDYNEAIQRVGEVIDAAGVAIMFVGALIAAVAATVRLARHDMMTYPASASSSARRSCSAWSCWWPAISSAPSPPYPP